jgi:TBC domain-containing protein kinase-like protein
MEAQFNECILLFSDMPAVDIDNVVSTSMDIFVTTPASLTWREHDSADSVKHAGPLDMAPLPVAVLKAEKVGRISGSDLLNLLETGRLLCLDVRPAEEHRLGSLAGSSSLPAASAFGPDGELVGPVAREVEEAGRKGQLVAVVGTVKDKAAELGVAEALLRLGVPRVATLHGGVEVFRGSGRLVVPNA